MPEVCGCLPVQGLKVWKKGCISKQCATHQHLTSVTSHGSLSVSVCAFQVFEQVNTLHKEVGLTVSDMVKSHKVYSEDEHVAHEAREKASQVEDK